MADTNTEAAGTISRGKYTLEIRLELLIRLLLADVKAVENKVHGNIAEKTKIG